LNFKKEFDQSSFKYKDIKIFFFYPSKRWDIQTIDNVVVKLPSKNTSLALERAKKIIESKQFNNNIIDLRITKQIILTNE
jgi:cell division septal protein FtsQ